MLWQLQWREHSWWHLRQCRPAGLELFVPAAQMCHQYEQDQSGSDADVDQMNTRAVDALAMRQQPTGRKTRRSECRLHSNVDGVHDASPAAAGQQREGGRGLVWGPNPAALQITLLTISTGTPQSGRTVSLQQRVVVSTVKGSWQVQKWQ